MKRHPYPPMRMAALLLSAASVVIGGTGGILADETEQAKIDPTSIHEINPRFTTDLYQQLRKEKGNIFFSPYSITAAMGMVYMGSKGDTASEFAKTIHLPGDQESFGRLSLQHRGALQKIANQKENSLNIANALCVTGPKPKDSYQHLARRDFDAEIFNGGLEEINGWVSKKTQGHIDTILDDLDPNSACVLLNAVYFKGTWENPFKPSNTYKGFFFITPKNQVEVSMMSRDGLYATISNEACIAVELPYQTSCSMILLMPSRAEDFDRFEASIDDALIRQLCKLLKTEKQRIELQLPKFKIETKYDLVPTMKDLGLVRAFDASKADFSAMYDRDDISISQIKHKATLEVDELGSVASAATAVEMHGKSGSIPSHAVSFDRPFLVMIRENATDTTLFMGRISDPSKLGEAERDEK